MVYPRGTSTQSLVKLAALCALTLSAIPSTFGDDIQTDTCTMVPTAEMEANNATYITDSKCEKGGKGCQNAVCRICQNNSSSWTFMPSCTSIMQETYGGCSVSDDDAKYGVQVIDDTSCKDGGLGCFDGKCRFCKVTETPKSAHLDSCAKLGVFFPAVAAPTLSTGACGVSDGDVAVGISVVTDTDCLYGGIGCYNDHCRLCKETLTVQSEAFLDCGSVPASTVPVTTTPTLTCSTVASEADIAAGLSIITDTSCGTGGVGCIDNVCRFCKVLTTAASWSYTDCAKISTSV